MVGAEREPQRFEIRDPLRPGANDADGVHVCLLWA
jgi:hypothetical protein